VARGLVRVDMEDYGGLRSDREIGAAAAARRAHRPALREENRSPRAAPAQGQPGRRLRGERRAGAVRGAARRCRRALADEHGVPAYVIFHDATLAQMAAERPRTLADLAQINGVGAAKLERYGEAFLAVIGGMTP
jgi:ATP-dependent DNA helicase RecQ